MTFWTAIRDFAAQHSSMARLVGIVVVGGLLVVVFSTLFRDRKIQPDGFKWNALRNELIFASVFGMFTGYLIGFLKSTLNHGALAEDA
jgi:hypothetical protein